MQKILLLTSIGLLFFYMFSFAQQINADSLALVSKINADQIKLDKLQSQLEQKTKDKQDALASAQRSANRNSNAADKLSDNADNKKLARKANRKAGDARSDARKARKASDRLEKLQKDIQDVTKRIANNQAKLNKYIQDGRTNP
jgi:Skp family chaperone for outer membrane proteins